MQFEKLVQEYTKNKLDMQIPGYKPNDKSTSYLFEISSLQGFRVP